MQLGVQQMGQTVLRDLWTLFKQRSGLLMRVLSVHVIILTERQYKNESHSIPVLTELDVE